MLLRGKHLMLILLSSFMFSASQEEDKVVINREAGELKMKNKIAIASLKNVTKNMSGFEFQTKKEYT